MADRGPTPVFTDAQEIRMGSPYRIAQLSFEGPWRPDLPDRDWQDIHAVSPDGRYLALVAWDIVANSPGFRVFVIDTDDRTVRESTRFEGCCSSLTMADSSIEVGASLDLSLACFTPVD